MKFRFAFFFLLVISISTSFGQICPCYDENGDPTGETDCCPTGDPVPLQGLPLLIGAGVIYGVIKSRRKKAKNQEDIELPL